MELHVCLYYQIRTNLEKFGFQGQIIVNLNPFSSVGLRFHLFNALPVSIFHVITPFFSRPLLCDGHFCMAFSSWSFHPDELHICRPFPPAHGHFTSHFTGDTCLQAEPRNYLFSHAHRTDTIYDPTNV